MRKKNVVDPTFKNTRIKKERKQKFCFRFVTESGGKHELTNLNANKLPGLSDLPAWALKDWVNEK